LSKAFSLAGLRVGWLAAPREVFEAVMIHRDYNTISISMVDDYFASLAMESHENILARSHEITRGNLRTLAAWVEQEPKISWVKPRSGTTAMLKYELDVSSRDFCTSLLKETGVLFTPGSAFDMEGYVRIGYANGPAVLSVGLEKVSAFLAAR